MEDCYKQAPLEWWTLKANYMGNQGLAYLLVYVLGRCLKERQNDIVVSTGTALGGKALA